MTVQGTVAALATNQATIGPGFQGTVSLPTGALDSLTASLNDPTTPGELVISQSGAAQVGGSFLVAKVFTGVNLLADTTYQFSLTKTQLNQLGVLGDLALQVSVGARR